jgi:type I restriction enzyme, S subunit
MNAPGTVASYVSLGEAPLQIIDGDRGANYPKQNEFEDSGYCLFLNAGNVTPAGFKFDDCQFIDERKDRALRKGRLERDDIVLTTRGTLGNIAHYTARVPFENVRINSGMVILRADGTKLDPRYLYCVLRSTIVRDQINQLKSGVAQPQLPVRDIKRIRIPLPDLQVQARLADIISAYDNLVANNELRVDLLDRSARLLFEEWFVRLRYPGHGEVNTATGLPGGWRRTSAYDAFDILSGGTPKTGVANYWGGRIPFYTPKDASDFPWVSATERYITEAGLKNCNSTLYDKGTVFITARGTVGRLNLAQVPMAMSQSCYALIGRNGIHQLYVYLATLNSFAALKQQASGAVFDAIIIDTFKRISVLVPDGETLGHFVERVSPYYALIETLVLQREQTMRAGDLLLSPLINGSIAA